MNIFIRTDASTDIGTGHVMRCLVLAEDLRKNSINVTFICRRLPGDLIEHIAGRAFTVVQLYSPTNSNSAKEDKTNKGNLMGVNWKVDARQTINAIRKQPVVDWLIIDHYEINHNWERKLKPFAKKVMVIDDLANRSHDCDLLLDQNLYKNMEQRYEKLIPEYTTTLLGPKYLLLRQEFREIQSMEKGNNHVKRILVSFGGSDPTNETMKAIKAIKIINEPNISIDVVIGITNRNYSAIKKFCKEIPNIRIHFRIDYLAELMAEADLAVGAGGSTTWERCYLRLPAITIETAKNQSEILSYLSEKGVISHLGNSKKVTVKDIANNLREFINHPNILKDMVAASKLMMRDFKDFHSVSNYLSDNNDV